MLRFLDSGDTGRYNLEAVSLYPQVRTWRRIAEILARRGNPDITPARAARICRKAEMKIAAALLADPVIRERFMPQIAKER